MAEPVDVREVLAEAFAGLDEAALGALVEAGEEVRIPAGRQVITEGGDADALHVVQSGSVRLSVHQRHRDLAFATLEPGDLLGWSWLVAPHRWDFDATAVGDTTVCRIPAAVLVPMMHDDPAVAAAVSTGMLSVLSRRLRDSRIQMLDLFAAQDPGVGR